MQHGNGATPLVSSQPPRHKGNDNGKQLVWGLGDARIPGRSRARQPGAVGIPPAHAWGTRGRPRLPPVSVPNSCSTSASQTPTPHDGFHLSPQQGALRCETAVIMPLTGPGSHSHYQDMDGGTPAICPQGALCIYPALPINAAVLALQQDEVPVSIALRVVLPLQSTIRDFHQRALLSQRAIPNGKVFLAA